MMFEAELFAGITGKGSYRIDHSPPDVLGIYIFLPVAKL